MMENSPSNNLKSILEMPSEAGGTFLTDSEVIGLWRMMMYKSGATMEQVDEIVANNKKAVLEEVDRVKARGLFWDFSLNKITAEEALKQFNEKRNGK